jgi:hypothetical protein
MALDLPLPLAETVETAMSPSVTVAAIDVPNDRL